MNLNDELPSIKKLGEKRKVTREEVRQLAEKLESTQPYAVHSWKKILLEGDPPNPVCHMDFWSDNDDEIAITTVAGNLNLPNVVVADLPSGITIIRVVAMLKIALIKDTSGADNAVVGVTMALKVDADSLYGSTVAAIDIPDNSWAVDVSEATERGGDVMIGDNDIASEVTGNATYYGRFENADCDGNNLKLKDVAWGVRVYFTI